MRAAQNRDTIDCCTAPARALEGWSWKETNTLLAVLPDDVHAALHPNADALANALAHPDRQDAFRQAPDALDMAPPFAALPARYTPDALTQATTLLSQRQASEGLAQTLRAHGDCFLAIMDTLADAQQAVALPVRDNETHAGLHVLAVAAPPVVHYLAYALRDDSAAVALNALAAASPMR